jgi:AcrR family transcriptional regulator
MTATVARSKRRQDTRERIVGAGAELMRLQGCNATGIKRIVAAAQAPFGSIYHHFPSRSASPVS